MIRHNTKSSYKGHPEEACITDLEQNVQFTTATKYLPCLVTHGIVTSVRSGQIFTGKEHLLAMGEPIYGQVHGVTGPSLMSTQIDNDELSVPQLKMLAGQGIHMHILAPLLVYGLSTLTRK